MMDAAQKSEIAELVKAHMVSLMLDKRSSDTEEAFRYRLKAFWNLAYSHGRTVGTIEGYNMAKNNEPLGQIAHLN